MTATWAERAARSPLMARLIATRRGYQALLHASGRHAGTDRLHRA